MTLRGDPALRSLVLFDLDFARLIKVTKSPSIPDASEAVHSLRVTEQKWSDQSRTHFCTSDPTTWLSEAVKSTNWIQESRDDLLEAISGRAPPHN